MTSITLNCDEHHRVIRNYRFVGTYGNGLSIFVALLTAEKRPLERGLSLAYSFAVRVGVRVVCRRISGSPRVVGSGAGRRTAGRHVACVAVLRWLVSLLLFLFVTCRVIASRGVVRGARTIATH